MIAYYRRYNPSGKAAINDYEVLRSDKRKCYLDFVKDLDLDVLGLQGNLLKNKIQAGLTKRLFLYIYII